MIRNIKLLTISISAAKVIKNSPTKKTKIVNYLAKYRI